MTVGELIEILEKVDSNWEVEISHESESIRDPVEEVRVIPEVRIVVIA